MIWKRGIVTRFHSNTLDLIDLNNHNSYNCVLRGKFKKQKIRPIVGDYVEYSFDKENKIGKVENIIQRNNLLYRPKIANVDQVLLIISLKDPIVDNLIVDKFLIQVEKEELECIIIINKIDLLKSEEEKDKLNNFLEIYEKLYTVIPTSITNKQNFDSLKLILKNKINTLAGMSGVGKSSLLNCLDDRLNLKVGEISDRLKRGKHTTTHAELIYLNFGSFIADTPGFANLELNNFKRIEIKNFFIEFDYYKMMCEFSNCNHINEPFCGIKNAVEENKISKIRYNNYIHIYNEINEKGDKKW